MTKLDSLMPNPTPVQYDESNIRSLDWKEHIQLRPGMYIGKLGDGSTPDDGVYVLIKEVLDNSIDEYVMGHGRHIDINIDDEEVVTKLTFNDLDSAISIDNKEEIIEAPKTLERLENISASRSMERKLAEEEDSDDDDERIKIHTDTMDLSGFDILDEPDKMEIESANIMLEAEELL